METPNSILTRDQDGAMHKSEEIWQNLLTAMILEETNMFQPPHWSWLKKKLYPMTHEKVRDFIPQPETVKKVQQRIEEARHDWLREEIVWLKKEQTVGDEAGSYNTGFSHSIQTIIDRYQSELDHPKEDNK